MSSGSKDERRRRRVKRLKRMIVTAVLLFITVPTALCILLACRLHVTENELAEMTAQYEAQLQVTDEIQVLLDDATLELTEAKDRLSADDSVSGPTSGNAADAIEVVDDTRKVYLTFDDGPSIYTEEILDILDEYDVKATFFVTGTCADNNPERYKEIVDRGHTLAMHTYSHVYSDIYKNKENFVRDFTKLRSFLTETTGVTPTIYRFPGGSSNTVSRTDMDELCKYLEDNNVTYFDWNVSSGDATSQSVSASRITNNVIAGVDNKPIAVVLFHDTSAKHSTVEALPGIIEQLQAMDNVEILPITEDTEVIQHKRN